MLGALNNNLEKYKKENLEKSSFFYYRYFFLGGCLILFEHILKNLNFFSIRKFKNYFFVFSLPVPVPIMYLIYCFVIACIFYYLFLNFKKLKLIEQLAWVFVVSGAISNIGERVILGYVIDWIYIFNGVFNLADGYIVAGIVLIFLQSKESQKFN